LKKKQNKAISTVFGSILFIILAVTVASTLFTALYKYNYSVQEEIRLEEERMQERIVLSALETQNISGTEYITKFYVNNSGSITSRIRAVYINSEFLCDPSDPTINPGDTYINSKEQWREILLPPGVVYNQTAKMAIVTERGIKSVEYESILKRGGGSQPPYEQTKFYFGPLMLDFNKFYYTECDPQDGSYDPTTWKAGWSIEIGTGEIAWNITVKNVDDRNITINQFSCFTLVPNDEPSERRAWYIEPPGGLLTQFIASNDTVNIIYIWKTPKTKQTSPQSIYTTVCRDKVFLTFFGIFHEHDGTTKPYGQTIPFEAVLCVRTGGSIEVSASPTVILAGSAVTSTITAGVYSRYGNPIANANVTFSTTLGTLSKLWAMTNLNGIATVTLYPSASPGIANITATWQGLAASTTVIINGAPVALFTMSPESIETGDIITFDASDSYDPDGSIVSYLWDFGDGTTATDATVNHAYAENGIYTVTLTITDNYGAIGTASAVKTVGNRLPVASFTESATNVLTNEVIYFNASDSCDPDGTIEDYSWDFGDGNTATGKVADHAYADNGNYTVTLAVTDDDGATDEETALVRIKDRPPEASFTESVEDWTVTFDASASYDPDGSIVSYLWNFGDGNVGAGVTVSHSYSSGDGYVVTLTIADNDGQEDTETRTITIPQ